jgi:molybdate transport system substrate-binding protein
MIGRPVTAWGYAAIVSMVFGAACRGSQDRQEVTVFAAASLAEAFHAIEDAFESEHEGADLVLNLAGSQVLATQLTEGAPADVFASANSSQIDRVRQAGRIFESQPFATNRLVIATPVDDPAGIESFRDLARPGLRIVLAGPAVPAGAYARDALDQLDVNDAVLANIVSNEDSVRGVVSKLQLGEADAGIVYSSDLEHSELRQISLPPQVQVAVIYEVATLTDAPRPELAAAVEAYLGGDTGSTILADHGFGAP